jgi:nitrogen fixation protein FixH
MVLLGLQLAIGAVAINLATGDSSAVVIPDYHTAALNWDTTHRNRTALSRMGLRLAIEPSELVDGRGQRAIRVIVTDANGHGVDGLHLSAQAYHHAHGQNVESFDLESLTDGTYQAIAPMNQSGLWQLELSFDHGNEQVSVLRTIELK